MQKSATKIADSLRHYLKTSGQLELLPAILANLKKDSERIDKANTVIITTPYKLDKAELEAISSFIQHKIGRKYKMQNQIDASLVTGFVLTLGDRIIDTSLKSRLTAMRKH